MEYTTLMNKHILDWNKYLETARQVAQEGCILLKNDNRALPFEAGTRIAVFGRMQNHYYNSGTGSGGMVNVDRIWSIVDGLTEAGASIDSELAAVYDAWDKANPVVKGMGWGTEPWSQAEMPVSAELASSAAERADAALVIIARTAGEDHDNTADPGSWQLTSTEEEMLSAVRSAFKRMVVVLNTGNLIDMSFIGDFAPDAVLLSWQGGMTGGLGVADVLTGKASPSGKLTDTIAATITDYPAYGNFGDTDIALYEEDIYVGYRYFETAAREKVLYPFGFGLSYADFSVKAHGFSVTEPLSGLENISASGTSQKDASPTMQVSCTVTNTGASAFSGKETVQLYVEKPQGLLGQPSRVLIGFQKTPLLAPKESAELSFEVNFADFASFDDTGVTGNKSCMINEQGTYRFYLGTDVRSAEPVGAYQLEKPAVTEILHEALAPVISFDRLHPVLLGKKSKIDTTGTPDRYGNRYTFTKQKLQAKKPSQVTHRNDALSKEKTKYSVMLSSLENAPLLSELTDDDLISIVRGEGMGSPRVTPGTAAGFGGVTEHMKTLGIPCACCDDGPSGMRLDTGDQAFSMPCGTMMASTWNPELIEKLYGFTGLEMVFHQVDILLGPGVNIHRYPLNGRNFEYFSEDPFVTGTFASATIRGLHSAGVSGSLKHFCCNNQETARHTVSSTVSQRALREIYLKGYEMAVKNAGADVIMTTYGAVNNTWTAGCYDLNTLILRKEWGFTGITMTDWWANVNDETKGPSKGDFASMVRAQNDLYMVCPDSSKNLHGDNLEAELASGTLTRAELLRAADNIISYLKKTPAWKRMNDAAHPKGSDLVEIVNRPETACTTNTQDVQYYTIPSLAEEASPSIEIDGSIIDTSMGSTWSSCLDITDLGNYGVEIEASSQSPELAQMPVLLSLNGIPICTYTFNGTGGKTVNMTNEVQLIGKHTLFSLHFAQSGLEIKTITVKYVRPL